MKKLYNFYWNCGRMGELHGLFIADHKAVSKCIGKTVCFGKVLGKHSEIHGDLEEKNLKVISDDQEFINDCLSIFGNETLSGYNPLLCIKERQEEVGDD